MKRIILFMALVLLAAIGRTQSTVLLRGDTIRVFKQGDTANLKVDSNAYVTGRAVIGKAMTNLSSVSLNLTDTTRAIKLNKMYSRTRISTPTNGMLLYEDSVNKFLKYEAGAWGVFGGGAGSTNSNIGSGFRWAVPNTNNIKTVFGSNTVIIDSASNANALTIKADTSKLATQYDLTLISPTLTQNQIAYGSPTNTVHSSDSLIFNPGNLFYVNVGANKEIVFNSSSFIIRDAVQPKDYINLETASERLRLLDDSYSTEYLDLNNAGDQTTIGGLHLKFVFIDSLTMTVQPGVSGTADSALVRNPTTGKVSMKKIGGATPGIDDVLAVGQALTANRSVTQDGFTLGFLGHVGIGRNPAANNLFEVYNGATTLIEVDTVDKESNFKSDDGTAFTELHTVAKSGSNVSFTLKANTGANQVSVEGDAVVQTVTLAAANSLFLKVNNYTGATNGDVLTLLDNTTGETQWAAGGSAPILPSTEIAFGNGTDPYTSSADFVYDSPNQFDAIIAAGVDDAEINLKPGVFQIRGTTSLFNFFKIDWVNGVYTEGDLDGFLNNTFVQNSDASQTLTYQKGSYVWFSTDIANATGFWGNHGGNLTGISWDDGAKSWDIVGQEIEIGDLNNIANSIKLALSDAAGSMIFTYGGGTYLDIRPGNGIFALGDLTPFNNGTKGVFDDAAQTITLSATNGIIFSNQARLKNYTVATLPAGTQGDIVLATDLLLPAFFAIVTGGGAVVGPVYYDGTNWRAF